MFGLKLLNFLLPPRCICCGKILQEHNGLCADCFSKIHFISKPLCQRCGYPFHRVSKSETGKLYCGSCLKKKRFLFSMQRSAFIYDDFSKKLIIDFKFRDKTFSASVLANILYTAGSDIWAENPDLLIPVPIHPLRLLKRRYNQCSLLTKYLSAKCQIPVDYNSLIRRKNTIPQVELSGTARRQNLKTAFMVKYPQNIKDKKIVLIDDVSTTGSTLNECAKVLRYAGASAIYSLTLGRVIK